LPVDLFLGLFRRGFGGGGECGYACSHVGICQFSRLPVRCRGMERNYIEHPRSVISTGGTASFAVPERRNPSSTAASLGVRVGLASCGVQKRNCGGTRGGKGATRNSPR
jgi:hypothetical protein